MFGSDYSSVLVPPPDHIGGSTPYSYNYQVFSIICRIWPVCFGHKWSHYYQLWYIGTYNAFKGSIFPFNKENIQKQIPNLFDTHIYLSSFPGSFGLWGSLLAGGDVIAAKGTSNSTLSEEDRVYLRSGMSGWLYVDTRDQTNVRVLRVNTSNETFTPAESNL